MAHANTPKDDAGGNCAGSLAQEEAGRKCTHMLGEGAFFVFAEMLFLFGKTFA